MISTEFLERWKARLEEGARLVFEEMPLAEAAGTHCDIGDGIAVRAGLKPIGFNWELLDAEGAPGEPRAALSVLTRALTDDMEYPKQSWLGEDGAASCAQDFVALFERPRTIISNRIEDYWNPLSTARIEWAFVGFDEAQAVLMLLMRD